MNQNLYKEAVRKSFLKAAGTYNAFSTLQKEVSEELLSYLPEALGKETAVLDIGCGTGYVTEGVKKRCPSASVYGCDIADTMLEAAKEKCAGLFFGADAESLPIKDAHFDVIVSSLAYQWVMDISAAFKETSRVLKPGGVFVFSTLGTDTFTELRQSVKTTIRASGKNRLPALLIGGLPAFMPFRKTEEIKKTLAKAGFDNITADFGVRKKTYGDVYELLKTLKNIGAGNPFKNGDQTLARGRMLKEIDKTYKERFPCEKGIKATYEVIFFRCEKP